MLYSFAGSTSRWIKAGSEMSFCQVFGQLLGLFPMGVVSRTRFTNVFRDIQDMAKPMRLGYLVLEEK